MAPHRARRRWAYLQTISFAVALSYLLLAAIDDNRAEQWWWPYALVMAVLTGATLLCYRIKGRNGR